MAVMSEKQATPDYEEFLKTFTSTCLQKGLLDRPDSLELKDSCDGLLDQPTLLYAATRLQKSSLLTINQTFFNRSKI